MLGPTLGQFRGLRKFTYPVCLFSFTVREAPPFFSWLAEPTLNGGAPKLAYHEKVDCLPLTDELLGQIVERVVAWYDALGAVLIA